MTTAHREIVDPGDQAIVEQRNQRAQELLAGIGHSSGRALDLGCGQGDAPGALGLAAVGIDLGILRLRLAPIPVAQADGARLPFADGTFDLVLALGVFGSIPVEGHRRVVAAEVVRVLSPTGLVLWYDQRRSGSRSTRAVTPRDLGQLFPGRRIEVEPITLAPGLARAIPRKYDLLHHISPLRSHLIGLISPP